MATLPVLLPNGAGTSSDVTVVGAASAWQAITSNDGDTSYVTPGLDLPGALFVALDPMPADFQSLTALSVAAVVRLNGNAADDSTSLYAQVFAADGTTALTEEVTVATQTVGAAYTTRTAAFATRNSATSKAVWDGAQLRLRWTFAKSKGSDGIALRVTQASLTGTYTPTTPPTSAPTLTSPGKTATSVSLSWSAVTGTGYRLWRDGSLLASPGGTSYTDSTVSPGGTYSYVVAAYNSNGDGPESAPLAVTTPTTVPGPVRNIVITDVAAPPTGATVPDPPTIGAATGGDGSASVTFTAPASDGGAAIVEYRVTPTPAATAATGTASPIAVAGLSNGTGYTFTVAARNSAGWSVESAPSNSVTPTAPPPPLPDPPAMLAAAAGGTDRIDVTWSAVTGATSYDLEVDGTVVPGVSSPYGHTGLAAQSTHTYRVRVTTADGTSGWSAQASATTDAEPPPAAAVLTESGSLRTLAATYPVLASGTAGYVTPTASDRTAFAALWTDVMAGNLTAAATAADPFGYEVVDYTDTETSRQFVLLRERTTRTRWWGLYVWSLDPDARDRVVAQVHTQADIDTEVQSADLLLAVNARAAMFTGTHRNASATLDGDGDNVTDVANASDPPSSVFQAVVEATLVSTDLLIEMHGMGPVEPMGSAHFAGDRFVVFEAATTATVGIPDGTAFGNRPARVGDRVLAQLTLRGDYAWTASEAGWTTLVTTADGTSLSTVVLTRELTQADLDRGSFAFGGWPSSKGSVTLVCYESCDIVTPIDGAVGVHEPGSSLTAHSTSALTTTVADCVLVMFMSVTNATKWDDAGASFSNGAGTTFTAKRRTAADTTTTGSSSTSLYDSNNEPVAAGTWTGTAVNPTASSIGGFTLIALRPREAPRETELILSHGGAPWPAQHIVDVTASLTAAGFNAVANDQTWPFTATGNVQGQYLRSLTPAGRFLHVEQINRVRTTQALREQVVDVVAAYEATALPEPPAPFIGFGIPL